MNEHPTETTPQPIDAQEPEVANPCHDSMALPTAPRISAEQLKAARRVWDRAAQCVEAGPAPQAVAQCATLTSGSRPAP